MSYSFKTHQGKRKDNQDYAGIFFNQENIKLSILCDGLGGHQAGDIASEMAVSQIGNVWEKTLFTKDDIDLVQDWLLEKINQENTRIFEAANTYSDLEGMGTTLVASVVFEHDILFSNIGDSRAYLYSEEQIELVTEDHSFVSELQRQGAITDLEASSHYNKNALTRSLGVEGRVDVDFFKRPVDSGEIILMNSDGVSNVVSEEEIINILKMNGTVEEKADALIHKALENDASDNITVILDQVHTNTKEKVGESE